MILSKSSESVLQHAGARELLNGGLIVLLWTTKPPNNSFLAPMHVEELTPNFRKNYCLEGLGVKFALWILYTLDQNEEVCAKISCSTLANAFSGFILSMSLNCSLKRMSFG